MKKPVAQYSRENDLLNEFLKANKIIKKFYANIKDFNDSDEYWTDTRKNNHSELWLIVAFPWRKTKEGFEFWRDIHNKFLEYLKTNNHGNRKGEETTKG